MEFKKNFKNTETAKNLAHAYTNETRLAAKYKEYAAVAKFEGYKLIEEMLEEFAENESDHAEIFQSFLLLYCPEEDINISFDIPIRFTNDTMQNLRDVIKLEDEEAIKLYPEFAKQALADGYKAVADAFNNIAAIEKRHSHVDSKLLAHLENGTLYSCKESVEWKCHECGHLHKGTEPPISCPVCTHSQGMFEIYIENF